MRERNEKILLWEGHIYQREVIESARIYRDGDVFILEYRSGHALALEFGGRPHWAPYDRILKWVLDRGILFATEDGAISVDPTIGKMTAEQTAKAIWISISKHGTKETRSLTRAIDQAPPLAEYVAVHTQSALARAISRGGVA